jgi:alpha-glucosidase
MADGGYDVADYRAIDPTFGTLADAEALIAEALELGIRTIVDVVPNHVSDRHPWFQAALAAGPGSPERERFWFRPGAAPTATSRRPAGCRSSRAGRGAGPRTPTARPATGTSTCSPPSSLILNWDHPDVRAEHEAILRFWFDRGAAGVRIDSAALLVKDPAMPEVPDEPLPGAHPTHDRDDLHDIYRGWRRSRTSTPAIASSSARSGCPTPTGSPASCAPTSSTRPSTSTSWPAVGRREPARVDRRDARGPRPGRCAGDVGPLEP